MGGSKEAALRWSMQLLIIADGGLPRCQGEGRRFEPGVPRNRGLTSGNRLIIAAPEGKLLVDADGLPKELP